MSATRTIVRRTVTIAAVRSRRVQASLLVRPLSARPNGPTTAIAAVTTPVIGQANASAPVNTAAHTSATFGLVEPHHRRANRVALPEW